MVLFSLILAVGMLVDDAIIVSEYAERRMAEGMAPKEAYSLAAKRMSGPVIAATLTRIAAFSPLLFWPGVVGQFMKYLPITLIATLSASLAVALFFTPTLGALLGRAAPVPHDDRAKDTGPYMRTVKLAVRRPGMTLALVALLLGRNSDPPMGNSVAASSSSPAWSPTTVRWSCTARGNLSLDEKDHLIGEVEKRVLEFPGLATVYARIGEQPRGMGELTEDTIGVIQFEFANWQTRPPAHAIMDALRERYRRHPGHSGRGHGAACRTTDRQADPSATLRARSGAAAGGGAARWRRLLAARDDIRDLDDGQPLPGIDWTIEVDKAEAAKYGAGINTVGAAVQLVTNGLKATEYRPADSDKAVDILVRFPPERRSLDQLDELHIQTQSGHVPIGNFVATGAVAARGLHPSRQRQSRHHGLGQRGGGYADRAACSRRCSNNWPKPTLAPA